MITSTGFTTPRPFQTSDDIPLPPSKIQKNFKKILPQDRAPTTSDRPINQSVDAVTSTLQNLNFSKIKPSS